MRKPKTSTIKCPCCGAEYLPGEIYLPKEFLGQPTCIERDAMSSQVRDYFGSSMNLKEHYICDFCNTPFKVTAKVNFNTYEDESFNFNKDYAVPLKKKQLFFDED